MFEFKLCSLRSEDRIDDQCVIDKNYSLLEDLSG